MATQPYTLAQHVGALAAAVRAALDELAARGREAHDAPRGACDAATRWAAAGCAFGPVGRQVSAYWGELMAARPPPAAAGAMDEATRDATEKALAAARSLTVAATWGEWVRTEGGVPVARHAMSLTARTALAAAAHALCLVGVHPADVGGALAAMAWTRDHFVAAGGDAALLEGFAPWPEPLVSPPKPEASVPAMGYPQDRDAEITLDADEDRP